MVLLGVYVNLEQATVAFEGNTMSTAGWFVAVGTILVAVAILMDIVYRFMPATYRSNWVRRGCLTILTTMVVGLVGIILIVVGVLIYFL